MREERRVHWWPALDGLRAVAVLAVVVYHIDEAVLPGGFLGVSLFFAISGFLIVGKLASEIDESGRIDLRQFWIRRFRRLAPALTVTVLTTVAVVAVRNPESIDRVATDALAASAYLANWREMAAELAYADFFNGSVQPLAHLWSLSVEEQFYVLAPLTIAVAGVRRAGLTGAVTVAAGVLIWWGDADAYFSTPVRIAEMMGGAILGVWVFRGNRIPAWLVRGAVPAAVVAAVATGTLSDRSPVLFKSGLVMIAIVWVPILAGAVVDGRFANVLSWAPLRWVGERSYAIYLFHLPIIELTDLSPVWVVATTLAAADVSLRLVESPIRAGKLPMPALAATLCASLLVLGAVLLAPDDEPDVVIATDMDLLRRPVPVSFVSPANTRGDVDPAGARTEAAGAPPPAVPSPRTSPTETPPPTAAAPIAAGLRVATLGDSTMQALEPALAALLSYSDAELVSRAVPGCSPLFTVEEEWSVRFYDSPDATIDAGYCRPSLDRVLAEVEPVDVVIILDHGMSLLEHRRVGTDVWQSIDDPEMAAALRARYQRWVDEAAAAGIGVVLATVPVAPPGSIMAVGLGADEATRVASYNDMVRAVAARTPRTVVLLDLAAAVDADADRYARDDGVHYTGSAAVAVVVEQLGPAVQRASALNTP